MFTRKSTYLIYESHGEYDDFTRIPLFVTDDYDFALMVRDELEKELELGYGELYNTIVDLGICNSYSHVFEVEQLEYLSLN